MNEAPGVLEVEADGTISYADGSARRILGEDIVGRSVDVLSPDVAAHRRHREGFAMAPVAKTMLGRRLTIQNLTGDVLDAFIGLLPVASGRTTVVLSRDDQLAHDGGRESLLTALHALDGILSDLNDASTDAIRLLDDMMETHPQIAIIGDGRHWKAVSRRFSEVLGWSRHDLAAETWETLVHPDDHQATVDATVQVIETGEFAELENRYKRRDGGYQRILWRWGPPGPHTGHTTAVGEDLGPA